MKTSKLHIYVTKQNIALGVKADCYKCPVALAIQRQIKTARVGLAHVYVSDNYSKLPPKACDFIYKFDRWPAQRRYLKPFRFTVEVPTTWKSSTYGQET